MIWSITRNATCLSKLWRIDCRYWCKAKKNSRGCLDALGGESVCTVEFLSFQDHRRWRIFVILQFFGSIVKNCLPLLRYSRTRKMISAWQLFVYPYSTTFVRLATVQSSDSTFLAGFITVERC